MRVLIGCEFSGVVRDEFRVAGHDAWSCDLEGVESRGLWSNCHLYGDVRKFLNRDWDMAIFFPPCTYLCSSGLHWNKRVPGRKKKTEEALEFVRELIAADIPRIALENPVGCIGTRIRKASQYIQPYQFGEDASKKTGLWLKNLPKLKPTTRVPGRMVKIGDCLVERWSNQTASGQNNLGPSEARSDERATTYAGIAKAMCRQWGKL